MTMRLYYYTSKQYGMKSLWEKRLKIGKYEDLNDPFELQAYQHIGLDQRKLIQDLVHVLSKDWGVICFSETWKSNLMWAHYADKHKGLCLGFDIEQTQQLTKIEYLRQRKALPKNYKQDFKSIASELLATCLKVKSIEWDYEKEHRLRVPLQEISDDVYYQKFGSILLLKEVIVGERCTLSINDVKEAVGIPDSDVDIWAVQPANTLFSMVPDKQFGRVQIRGYSSGVFGNSLLADGLRNWKET